MRRSLDLVALAWALAGTVAFGAGCEGCAPPPTVIDDDPVQIGREDDAGTAECEVDADCPFGEECVDGVCAAVTDLVDDEGCTADDDCVTGESCALTTGRCVPDASAPPQQAGPPGPCSEGETRTCGEKIGACEYGTERCVDDVWSGDCEGGRGPAGESCNGEDDDCNGTVDDGFILGEPCTEGLGACTQSGFVVCTADGDGTECSAVPLPAAGRVELCGNGVDDDCDGEAGDNIEFTDFGDACTAGAGTCATSGSRVCAGDGNGTVCSATPGTPGAVDLCGNGIDDDCSGVPDDDHPGVGGACSVGATCPVPGTFQCTADRLDVTCVAGAPVAPETLCNGVDDDGDTCPDDGFALGGSCAAGVGACRRTGTVVCNGAQNGTTCSAVAATGTAETCGNNVDEDCDGLLDNGFGLGGACTVGVGACQRSGVLVCGPAGTPVCSATAGAPTAERCGNVVDENCDGTVDEGFNLGAACTAGNGVCQRSGTRICNTANTLTAVCNAVPGTANPLGELCNNTLDDDCDTSVDEGFTNLNTACADGTGECRQTGTFICSTDRTATVCNAVAGVPAAESCDDRDNDCNTVIDNGCDDDGDDFCDAALGFSPIGPTVDVCAQSTSAAARDCNDANPDINPDAVETCQIDAIDMNCDGDPNDGCAPCNAGIDNDFDGSNQCLDCDDTNGAVRPNGTELCDGLDNDCDGAFDETFDADGDGFTTCGTIPTGGLDPARDDCNDTPGAGATIFPGACELCALGTVTVACGATNNAGNNIDEDCDGFRDETCAPCSNSDVDGDGASECAGDCNDSDGAVRPGRVEVCDGKDTDCNTTTVANCDVSEQCNDNQGPDTFDETADRCKDNLVCVQPVNGGGGGTGNPTCTSFCNFSFGGNGLGDGCTSTQICSVGIIPTANLHGCSEVSAGDFGTLQSGTNCNDNDDCRSGLCIQFVGGSAPPDYCSDFCGNDSYCGPTTVCQVGGIILPGESGRCTRPAAAQTRDTNVACTDTPNNCLHGPRSCINMNGTNRCSEPCCTNSDCPNNFYCSLNGLDSAATGGGRNTVPMCFPETAGNGDRQAGAACTTNTQCASEFCDENLGVCIDVCCHDDTCPVGLECEDAIVQRASGQSFGRFCLGTTPALPLEKR